MHVQPCKANVDPIAELSPRPCRWKERAAGFWLRQQIPLALMRRLCVLWPGSVVKMKFETHISQAQTDISLYKSTYIFSKKFGRGQNQVHSEVTLGKDVSFNAAPPMGVCLANVT